MTELYYFFKIFTSYQWYYSIMILPTCIYLKYIFGISHNISYWNTLSQRVHCQMLVFSCFLMIKGENEK